jgi:hypothetical protein
MRARGVAAGAAATAITMVGSLGTATSAHASNYGIELNGTYRAISNGDWAQNSAGPNGAGGAEVYIDEQTKIQTWTVTSDCVSPIECTGEVRSDEGWTASLRYAGDFWLADRDIPNWEPCPDGTAAPGHQKFMLWGWDPATSQKIAKITDLLSGFERTLAPSGACGVNKPLVVELPVRLEKTS